MTFRLHRRIEPLPILSARETAAIYKRCLMALMADARLDMCGIVCGSSWHDPVACAFPPEHDGPHSWASIPALPPLSSEAALRAVEGGGHRHTWVPSHTLVGRTAHGSMDTIEACVCGEERIRPQKGRRP